MSDMPNMFSDNNNFQMTLWMGDLDPWMDELFIKNVWLLLGESVVVKLIRDKRTSLSSGYAFIGFSSSQSAQTALTKIHGTRIPNSNKTFKLNWASGGGICDRKEDRAPEYSLFVGDLSSDVDETFLLSVFRLKYPSCHSAKIMTDPLTGISRGYGFVRFLNQNEQQEAVVEMNGVICSDRPMRVSFATPKNNQTRYLQLALQAPALVQQPTDPTNTTVFVGGLSSPVTEEELQYIFSPFGEISYVKIPPGKGCGFIQYVHRSSAERAIERMNGFAIGTSRIRLSWGRSQSDRIPTSPISFLFDHHPRMSPATTTTTLSTINNHHLLGSFKPLSPPQQQYNPHQLLFKSQEDWLNGPLPNDEEDWHLN
ncbi:uncharacterized protein EV154DRAFT_506124 [Mucor mucedo]|uniref:uncharacterized protein n=1 Tax=Mucor mucedo TaxID=29922 RepID=UPI00221F1C9E|nr:uncharacterized protein EV154DRAFT_506124 [Mucor mucedo]KAI7892040.1 hypothetical protein EV154DRAFT_506124 [Mucor mucedo]